MMDLFANGRARTRLRRLPLVLIALLGPGCTNETTSETTSMPLEATDPVIPSVTYVGMPYGPFGLYNFSKLLWGPAPFTGSHNYISADSLILQINAARNKGQRLMLAMTGGETSKYTTNGQFDLTKWKAVMNRYNKTTLKNAVATGVADGTIVGNSMMDEPETPKWGSALNKATINTMAAYVKSIFPTLPVGVDHGVTGYKWRPTERYTKLDYVVYQFVWWYTKGDVASWRTGVLAQAKLDGVTPAFSLNVYAGGVKDLDGVYDCTGAGQAGKGTKYPLCSMTPDQIKNWGSALLPYGCMMLLWRFDREYMSRTTNQTPFKYLATLAAGRPKRACTKP